MPSQSDSLVGPIGNRGSLVAYAGARLLEAAALTILALDMAEVAILAGGVNGALVTGVVLACIPLVSALVVPSVPRVTSWLGVRRTLAVTVTATIGAYALAVLALSAGVSALPLVVCLAVVLGVLEAFFYTLGPITNRAYFGIEMAQAYSRTRILVVVGFALAGLSAGLVIRPDDPGYGILVAALLTVPLAAVLWFAKPVQEPTRGGSVDMPVSAQISFLRSSVVLRAALLIAVATALFIYPVVTLIIPITASLDQVSVINSAGALLASQAVGTLAAPKLIALWTKPPSGTNLHAAIIGIFVVGAALISFALASIALSSTAELLVWMVVALIFGAGFGVCTSAGIGAVVDSVSAGQAVEAVGAHSFVVLVSLPVGLVLWGGLLNFTSLEVTLALAATGLIATAFMLRPRSLPSGAPTPPKS